MNALDHERAGRPLSAAKDPVERSDTGRAAGARSFAALRTTGGEAVCPFKKFDAFSCHFVTQAELGKISFGSSGVGAAAHLTSELVKQVTGVDMVHVSYTRARKGTAPALADFASWVMFLAPAGTPREIVDRLQGEVARAMADAALRKRFAEFAVVPAGYSPADTAKFLNDEIDKWGKVITTAGVKIDS